jgi:tyrosyl-tRNA synthetase
MLDDAGIARNKQGIQQIFNRYLSFGEAPTDAVMVDNADWLYQLNYLDFLRDVGSHFSVNRMLSFDSVKLRLEREQPLSFLEFNYMVLQGYDFVELAKRHDCRLQMGGSDQWGNIINGVELGRRMAGLSLFGLTTPLLTTSSGQKMGKTANGAVWLNADRCRPYDFWQYWRNTEDADVGRFLKLFTHLPLNEIARLAALQGAEINEAKKILATEVTTLCHGAEAAQEAAVTADATFAAGGTGAALPVVSLDTATLDAGISLADVLVQAGLVESKGEARRLIKAGAVRLDNTPCLEEHYLLTGTHITIGQTLKVSAGKKKHAQIQAI